MKIHFIGIGGIGVSALARYYLEKDYQVSGSDLVSSEITQALKKKGAQIFVGPHNPKYLTPDVKQLIYSPAVLPNNPELVAAKKLGIKIKTYPQALGELTKKHFTIAVAGSHGKSTVAAMIGVLLKKAGFSPTVIVGTKVKEFGDSNFRMGGFPKSKIYNLKSKILVIEADEHFASFLNYWPKIIVLTNIEVDHLDFYKNLKNILKTFKKFVSHLPENGILIANKEDKNIQKIIFNFQFSIFNKFSIFNFQLAKSKDAKRLKQVLKIPGEFNVSNALAALTVARVLKIPDRISFKALSEYRGSWRRFQIEKIKCNEERPRYITLISDYAHHPTQIKVTLKAAREKFPKKKIWVIFQPHQYQRTYYLWNDFVKVLSEAPVDKLIITDIYSVAGRESSEIKKKVSSEKLVREINKKNVMYIPNSKEVERYLNRNLKGGEVVIVMGAGDIYELSLKFKGRIK